MKSQGNSCRWCKTQCEIPPKGVIRSKLCDECLQGILSGHDSRLKPLLDDDPHSIFILDKKARIITANKAGEQYSHRNSWDMINLDLSEILHGKVLADERNTLIKSSLSFWQNLFKKTSQGHSIEHDLAFIKPTYLRKELQEWSFSVEHIYDFYVLRINSIHIAQRDFQNKENLLFKELELA